MLNRYEGRASNIDVAISYYLPDIEYHQDRLYL